MYEHMQIFRTRSQHPEAQIQKIAL